MTQMSSVNVGPYTLHVEVSEKGIKNVRISLQPLSKIKKLNNKIDQIDRSMANFMLSRKDAFDGLSLDIEGTEFQRKVWKATQRIPFGETRTYAQIAKQIGSPKAVRAVGTALGKNPVCIIVPCHRVVPSSGGIGQYAYGKEVKQWLLDHERP